MDKTCNVCEKKKLLTVYESPDDLSVTTMNKLISGKTIVYFCESCGHLQTNELANLKAYYAEEYEINLNSEDDDQLYAIIDNIPVYRSEHQANVLMKKVNLANDVRVLDYGCAKSQTLKRVLNHDVGIQPFFFDVTDKYIPYWNTFAQHAEWSTHTPNSAWFGTMDIVLSFYALEHVADLSEAINNIKKLLKFGGIFYFLVPNVYENNADFIVADHVNHFSEISLISLLTKHGFSNIEVDASAHEAAFVVQATLTSGSNAVSVVDSNASLQQINSCKKLAWEMASYWNNVVGRIQQFESTISEGDIAIYGAGFYGNFIAAAMCNPERIACFIDQNKHLQNTQINGKLVVSLDNTPSNVKHVLVGMNPARAKENIDQIESWKTLGLNYFFL